MGETPGVLEVADGEFACGMAAVISVGLDRRRFSALVPVGVLDRFLPPTLRCLPRPMVGGIGRLRLVTNAWYRQSGHSWAWGPSRRVQRITKRTRRRSDRFPGLVMSITVSPTCASPSWG